MHLASIVNTCPCIFSTGDAKFRSLIHISFTSSSINSLISFTHSTGQPKSYKDTELLTLPDKSLPCISVYKQLQRGTSVPCTKGLECNYAHSESESSLLRLLQCLNSARNEILICMYAFTFDKLGEMLLHKQQNGCTVKVITNISREDNENDQIAPLKSKGIKVRERALNKKDKYLSLIHI